MENNLNEELANRSIELKQLAIMTPDDRIARIVWARIQNDLEHKDSFIYGIISLRNLFWLSSGCKNITCSLQNISIFRFMIDKEMKY